MIENLQTKDIKAKAISFGFHKVGIAKIEENYTDSASERLQAWLDSGYQADMAWMDNPKRSDVIQLMPEARSIICVALNYYTSHSHSQNPEYAKISRYGWGRDYHRVMAKKLKQMTHWLQSLADNIQTRYYVDTAPIQDKVWAQRAGLGWIAKNGNLIAREYGSWIFLGEILTNLELLPDRPHSEHCGTCNRCIQACPTAAITEPFVVDANRCIAYHTIENRAATLPESIADNLSGWVAGCDICQDVCPWNQRFAKETDITEFQPYPWNVAPKLLELASISDAEWEQKFPASALRRIKPEMWRRNARANLK
jgi:epoxyqueuosine reductase